MAIISHMGRNTECGHYVAHVKKGDRWVLFNDEKVANEAATLHESYFVSRLIVYEACFHCLISPLIPQLTRSMLF